MTVTVMYSIEYFILISKEHIQYIIHIIYLCDVYNILSMTKIYVFF